MWSRFSVRAKIFALVGIPIVALSAAIVTLQVVSHAQQNAEDAVQHAFRVRQANHEAEDALSNVENGLWMPLFGVPAQAGSYQASRKTLDQKLAVLRGLVESQPKDVALVDGISKAVDAEVALYQKYGAVYKSGKLNVSLDLLVKASSVTEAPQRALAQLDNGEETTLVSKSAAAASARGTMELAIILAAILGIGGAIVFSILVARSFVRRIGNVTENARHLAAREPLIEPVGGNDEIGRLSEQIVEAAELLTQREDALITATEDAKRANQAKSEFLSRMSHELRTPLNSILGFGQLLGMGELAEPDRESVDLIMKGGRHLLSLINEVLDISRIEAGEFSLSVEPVHLAEVGREVAELMRPQADTVSVTISAPDPETCNTFVLADFQRLKQVLLNLVSNAVKFNRSGGEVRLTCETNDDMVDITVTDTGAGLTAEQIDRLFVPFERLDAERDGVEGTGLGLALAKRLVLAMGGTISVTSVVGQGSAFTLTLPLAFATTTDERAHPALPKREGSTTKSTMLYIEDNLSNVRLIERLIDRRPQIKLLTAMQGRMGIELATQHIPDLILLDLNLPDMAGIQVIERLRSDERTSYIPIVVVTADATGQRRAEIEALGIRQYATKPFDVDALLGILDETLKASV